MVSVGDELEVERLSSATPGQTFPFEEVLLYVVDGVAKFGTPFVSGVSVKATVVEHTKGDKIRVAKFKAKSRYRRVTGHRQSLTKVKIDSISDGYAEKSAKKAQPRPKADQHHGHLRPLAEKVAARKRSVKKQV